MSSRRGFVVEELWSRQGFLMVIATVTERSWTRDQ